jgi:hypothetical protein
MFSNDFSNQYELLCFPFPYFILLNKTIGIYRMFSKLFQFSGHEPIYFFENKEKTLRASYDRGTQIVDYMD